MYKAINKNFLKTIKAIIDRNKLAISGTSDGYGGVSYQLSDKMFDGRQHKHIDINNFLGVSGFIELNNYFSEDDEKIKNLYSFGLAKITGIYTPLILAERDSSAYKLFKKLGLYDDILYDGGYYPYIVDFITTHFMELEGYDCYDLPNDGDLDSNCIVKNLNYMTLEIPDKHKEDFYPEVCSNFDNICSFDTKTKRLRINGFYKQYLAEESKPNADNILQKMLVERENFLEGDNCPRAISYLDSIENLYKQGLATKWQYINAGGYYKNSCIRGGL